MHTFFFYLLLCSLLLSSNEQFSILVHIIMCEYTIVISYLLLNIRLFLVYQYSKENYSDVFLLFP